MPSACGLLENEEAEGLFALATSLDYKDVAHPILGLTLLAWRLVFLTRVLS